MASARKRGDCVRPGRAFATSGAFAAAVIAFALASLPALPQGIPRGLLAPGDAVVTGFPGAIYPRQVAPNVNPAVQTYIDLNGASLRIVDLQNIGDAPRGQLVNARKPFSVTAAQIGQVFGVALDNVTPPNIYVAATSAFGLHLVATGTNGQTFHAANGAPNARFMPGMWGQASPDGGPGSIWRIDGVTGAVSLFANVTLDGVPNSGPALGGLVYDPDSSSLFVADRDTGMIHRFGMNGAERGRYDHGLQGRRAQNLPPVAFNPSKRLNIESRDFRSGARATWLYPPQERLVFGLGISRGRLFYAVAAGPQIWSIGLNRDGSFGNDPRLEIEVTPAYAPAEISKITFDGEGRMILAERPAPLNDYAMHTLAIESIGRVLRYMQVDTQPGAPRIWQRIPDEYAIGMPGSFRNGNGGVAIGYSYDGKGALDRNACNGFLWSTGEQLRKTSGLDSVVRVSLPWPENVDGLQGNYIWLVRPQNTPPMRSYFIDYDDQFDDPAAHGHLGDIAIWHTCSPALRGGWMAPSWLVGFVPFGGGLSLRLPPPPKLECPVDQQKPGAQCCPAGTSPDAAGQCKPWCPSGAMDKKSQNLCRWGFDPASYDPNNPSKLRCIDNSVPVAGQLGGGCLAKSPVVNAPVCEIGYSKQNVPGIGTICQPVAGQGSCPLGQQFSPFDNKCHAFCPGGAAWPTKQCCTPDSIISGTGQCCSAGTKPDPVSGQCLPTTVCNTNDPSCPPSIVCDPSKGPCRPPIPGCDPSKGPCAPPISVCDPSKGSCPPPIICVGLMSGDGTCCKDGATPNNGGGGCCPLGQAAAANGRCMPIACQPPNKSEGGQCCSPADLQPGGKCASTVCRKGARPIGAGNYCCEASKIYTTAAGQTACCVRGTVRNGQCTSSGGGTPAFPGCQVGYSTAADGSCCQSTQLTSSKTCCPAGQAPTGPGNSQCGPIQTGIPPYGGGTGFNGNPPGGGQCCAPGTIPTASGMCCAASQATASGVCCPAGQRPNRAGTRPSTTIAATPAAACIPVQTCGLRQTMVNGACCANANVYKDASGAQQCCPQLVNQAGQCAGLDLRIQRQCLAGSVRMPDGSCCPRRSVSADGRTCRLLQSTPPRFEIPERPSCGPGMVRGTRGRCIVERSGQTQTTPRRPSRIDKQQPPQRAKPPRARPRAPQVPRIKVPPRPASSFRAPRVPSSGIRRR